MAETTKKPTKKAETTLKDLKIELLKNPLKRRRIKKEIAKLLTEQNKLNKQGEQK
jgi:hypothetical protein